mgnify:CR=1 FL=1
MLNNLIRPEFRDFTPYNANQIPYKIKLDANESPFDLPQSVRHKLANWLLEDPGLNLYPDTDSIELRNALAEHWGLDPLCFVIGTGSDQLIQVLIHLFVGKGDKVLCPEPSFSMYKLTTKIAGGIPVDFLLNREDNYSYSVDNLVEVVNREKIKLVFLCTPNNPTGGILPQKDIIRIIETCSNSVIVVDEAYAEFSEETAIPLVGKYQNLVVLRTFSKAYGLAGIRCGYSVSGKEMTDQINKIRPPYNISSLSQKVAKWILEEKRELNENIQVIVKEREYLADALSKIPSVTVYPSEANFILIKVQDSHSLNKKLMNKGVLVRAYGNTPTLENCLRITVGTRPQNDTVINTIKSEK